MVLPPRGSDALPRRWGAGWRGGECACCFPPGAPAATGIDAIHAFTVDLLRLGVTEFREETTAFYGNAEFVVDEGTYDLAYGQGLTERGKYINVWKQVDGLWRIQANIWNADPTAARP